MQTDENEMIIKRVKQAIEELRPYLQEDRGDMEFVRFEPETRTVEIRMLGRCTTCPMCLMTLRAGIERYLISKVPEVRRIEKVR